MSKFNHHLSHGIQAIQPTPRNHGIAKVLTEQGEYFFTSTNLWEAFGLASSAVETREAIDTALTFTKWLKSFD
jgi:predicted NodU family carbamoyl transferase